MPATYNHETPTCHVEQGGEGQRTLVFLLQGGVLLNFLGKDTVFDDLDTVRLMAYPWIEPAYIGTKIAITQFMYILMCILWQ